MSGVYFTTEPILEGFQAKEPGSADGNVLLADLEAYRLREHRKASCESVFFEDMLPSSLKQATRDVGETNTGASLAAFLLVFAAAAALRGCRRVETRGGFSVPLSLLGSIGWTEEPFESSLLEVVRSVFWEFQAAGADSLGAEKGLPFLYPELSIEACSFALRHSGHFLSLGPERMHFSPELGDLIAANFANPESSACLDILSLVPLQALGEFLKERRFGALQEEVLLYVPLPGQNTAVKAGAGEAIFALLRPLFQLSEQEGALSGTPELLLTEEAEISWQHYRKMKELPMLSLPEGFQAWRKKMSVTALKIAGLFELLENSAARGVGVESVRQAIFFMEVVEEHAYHAFRRRYTEKEFSCAADIIGSIQGRNLTRPQIYRELDLLGYTVDEIYTGLEIIGTLRSHRSARAMGEVSRKILEKNGLLLTAKDKPDEFIGQGVNF